MKGSRLYLLFLFAFLVIVFIIEYKAPHQFVWEPTYDKYDKEPFGSYVFDDVLSSSIDNYTVVNKTFYQLYQEDSTLSSQAFLLTELSLDFYDTDIDYLYKIIHLGNQVMLCSDYFSYQLRDTLHFALSYDRYFSFIEKNMAKDAVRDRIIFGTDTLHPECVYEMFPKVHPYSIKAGKTKEIGESEETGEISEAEENREAEEIREIREIREAEETVEQGEIREVEETVEQGEIREAEETVEQGEIREIEETVEQGEIRETGDTAENFSFNCDSVEILVWDDENKPLVIRAFIGKGELFIVTTPLMFTNFGILDGANASYVFRLLSFMKDRPLIRIEAYGKHGDKPHTPLRYILSEAPLRWATYSILFLLILFIFFTAKRRQRIIPVINVPPNRTLGFMQLISNLYYQKHNNLEILKMKYMYFCAEVKIQIGVDLYESVPDETYYERLIEKTGMDKDFINLLLKNIRLAINRSEVNDLQLQQYIDGMNELLHALM